MADKSFTPATWKDGSGGGTPITAAQLNRLETGMADLFKTLPVYQVQSLTDPVPSTPCIILVIGSDGEPGGIYYDDGKPTN